MLNKQIVGVLDLIEQLEAELESSTLTSEYCVDVTGVILDAIEQLNKAFDYAYCIESYLNHGRDEAKLMDSLSRMLIKYDLN